MGDARRRRYYSTRLTMLLLCGMAAVIVVGILRPNEKPAKSPVVILIATPRVGSTLLARSLKQRRCKKQRRGPATHGERRCLAMHGERLCLAMRERHCLTMHGEVFHWNPEQFGGCFGRPPGDSVLAGDGCPPRAVFEARHDIGSPWWWQRNAADYLRWLTATPETVGFKLMPGHLTGVGSAHKEDDRDPKELAEVLRRGLSPRPVVAVTLRRACVPAQFLSHGNAMRTGQWGGSTAAISRVKINVSELVIFHDRIERYHAFVEKALLLLPSVSRIRLTYERDVADPRNLAKTVDKIIRRSSLGSSSPCNESSSSASSSLEQRNASESSSSNNIKGLSPPPAPQNSPPWALPTSAAIRNWDSLPRRLKAGCV